MSSWGRLINQSVSRINIDRNLGIHVLLGDFLEISSENVFGGLFWWLPMGIKDT